MKIRQFQSELWLPMPPEELFPFFADAANLDAITPPWLNFRIVTPTPVVMREGALIDYRLRVRGLPLRWRTRINAWEPPHRFEDEQLRGPYRQWIHEHTFEARDGGTLARDRVRYSVPFDWLVHGWLVRPDIEKIFQHRSEMLKRRFAESRPVVNHSITLNDSSSGMKLTLSVLAMVFAATAEISAGDWPQFRGPQRDGVSRETNLLKSWPEAAL